MAERKGGDSLVSVVVNRLSHSILDGVMELVLDQSIKDAVEKIIFA